MSAASGTSTSGDLDAVVVGAGPNGLTAAAVLARAGWKVLVVEAAAMVGGGTRSVELTLPGFVHDVCSAIHPMGIASPALRSLPLEAHGVEWIHPEVPLVHPLDRGRAAVLHRHIPSTADGLGSDAAAYRRLMTPLVERATDVVDGVMAPLLGVPRHPLAMARFGKAAALPASVVARRFSTDEARGLFAGLSAHSILPLDRMATAGVGLLLGLLAHHVGWPMARGGSQSIADALAAIVVEAGGEIRCGEPVTGLGQLPPARATLLDLSPRAVVGLLGDRLPSRTRRALTRFRHGPGVFKVDWALASAVPWANPDARRAATVHLGATFEEIAGAEADVAAGRHPSRPYVLFAQQTIADPSRAPEGHHTAWAYCHVPNGSTIDQTDAIEAQVERFAPGFRDLVLERHVMGTAAMEDHDANYVGGDIAGGASDLRQLLARPRLSLAPWALPVPGMYLCSASTPPGGGVHGMCGWHAARLVLKRHGHAPD